MWCENLILFRKALKEQFAKKMKIQSPSTQPHADGQSAEAPQENSIASLSQTAEVDEDLFQNVEKTKTKKNKKKTQWLHAACLGWSKLPEALKSHIDLKICHLHLRAPTADGVHANAVSLAATERV